MFFAKYGLKMYSNRHKVDILIFKSMNQLIEFKNEVDKCQDKYQLKKIIDKKLSEVDSCNSVDILRNKPFFVDSLLEQQIVGNCIFNVISLKRHYIVILGEFSDPSIYEYDS